EERQPEHVIPVRVREQEMHALGAPFLNQGVAEGTKPGAGVERERGAICKAHFDARGVAAIAGGLRARCRYRPSDSVERDVHLPPPYTTYRRWDTERPRGRATENDARS